MTKIIAHRGASNVCPENTMPAFCKAKELQADGLELDIHFSKDQKIVVTHDETLMRCASTPGLVKDYNYSELLDLDFGSWFSEDFRKTRAPLLSDVFELVKDTNMIVNVEIKYGSFLYPGIEDALIEEVKKYSMADKVIVSSFNHYSLIHIKKLVPALKTGVLYHAALVEPWKYANRIGADALHPYYVTMAPPIIKDIRENSNLMINPYTVDDEIYMKTFILSKIDNIITNYVDKGIRIKKELMA